MDALMGTLIYPEDYEEGKKGRNAKMLVES
jgi:hypothetical protein